MATIYRCDRCKMETLTFDGLSGLTLTERRAGRLFAAGLTWNLCTPCVDALQRFLAFGLSEVVLVKHGTTSSPGGAMTPTDPELVTRLRLLVHRLHMRADCGGSRDRHDAGDVQAALAALDAARQREAALQDDPELVTRQLRIRLPNMRRQLHPDELTYCAEPLDIEDGRLLLSAFDAAEARVQQLEAALTALITKWSDAAVWEFNDMGHTQAAQIFDQCADDLKELAVGRADTQEPTP